MKKRPGKDVLTMSSMPLEMALVEEYEVRAVKVQDWEGMWTERGGKGVQGLGRGFEGLGGGG